MRIRRVMLFVTAAVPLILAATVDAGGGNLVTVRNFPDFAVAGKALDLTFKVWVPSLEPLGDLRPMVRATNERGRAISAPAQRAGGDGDFNVRFTFPEAGDWVIGFDTAYRDAATMPPLLVIAPAASRPVMPLETRGLRLFTTKGCNGCHLHEEVRGRMYGPDLTGKRFPDDYLRRFLADPGITPVPDLVCNQDRSYCGSPYAMPDLGLQPDEIDALVAFLTTARKHR